MVKTIGVGGIIELQYKCSCLDIGQVVPHPSYAGPRYKLAVVELDPLQVVAVDEMVEGLVGDERTVVKLKDGE